MKNDLISRKAAIDAVRKAKDKSEAHRMLVQLPSAQPTGTKTVQVDDCISRQAALTALERDEEYDKDIPNRADGVRDAIITISALPSAQPGWIPWDSGKFPEESGTYTVTAYDGATKRVTYAKYQKRLKRWELTGARAYWRVLAWMEKPKPWEGGQDNGSD